MTDIPLEEPASALARNRFALQTTIALALTALADWMFFEHHLGISVVLFALCLCFGMMIGNGIRKRRMLIPASLGLTLAIAPAIETLNLISFLFALAGTVFFILAISIDRSRGLRDWLDQATLMTVGGPVLLFMDARRFRTAATRNGTLATFKTRFSIWVLPLLFASLFIWLFAAANPLIEGFLNSLSLPPTDNQFGINRIFFWLAVLSVVWPFVRFRIADRRRNAAKEDIQLPPDTQPSIASLIQTESILISLVVFNLIFAVQTVLDITYLWGNAALPDGMTFAEYARRGTYPLMAAALLSAAFVLVALRPGTRAERTPIVRLLVFLWLGQNVLLVFAAAQRLNLYLDAYALTWLRVTAFVCIWLIAVGLALIIIRIALHRTNRWLIIANTIAVVATLYFCTLADIDQFIAGHNVRNSQELSGSGPKLDLRYLRSLGPVSIPALDEAIEHHRERRIDPSRIKVSQISSSWSSNARVIGPDIIEVRNRLAQTHKATIKNWRAWSFRGHRLARYIATYKPKPTMRERLNPHRF